MTRLGAVLFVMLLVACASGPRPLYDPLDPSTWGSPQILVVNESPQAARIYGPTGLLGLVEQGQSRCFRLVGITTGSIWLTAVFNEYERVRSRDFDLGSQPGWRWALSAAYRSDVFVNPSWPCLVPEQP